MQPSKVNDMIDLLGYAVKSGLVRDGVVSLEGKHRELETFGTLAIGVSKDEEKHREQAFLEEKMERKLRREAGVLDEGQDSDSELYDHARVGVVSGSFATVDSESNTNKASSCFAVMCNYMGYRCDPHATSVCQLDVETQAGLRQSGEYMVAYDWYSQDDPRNHVVAVVKGSKTAVVTVNVAGGDGSQNCMHGITSTQEFFNLGGRFYRSNFYADEFREGNTQGTEGFGDDARQLPLRDSGSRSGVADQQRRDRIPPPPESVVNGGAGGGAANVTGGVVRPKRRAINARGTYDVTAKTLRNYNVVGVTMFNNAEELFLNTVSREYAQEIIEDLFAVWELPTEQATTMKYAEDLLWTFLIARTASNKADYRVVLDVPTSKGEVEVSFDKFSRLLADKYGITRRNFARGVSDDLREFLCREENQFLRSRAAQRIGADPQMGGLCFDGSTGCSGLTSAETTFTRLLEARNLYERDDVIAEGASDKLMQGVHGGVRSIVPR